MLQIQMYTNKNLQFTQHIMHKNEAHEFLYTRIIRHNQKYKSLMNALLEGNDNGFNGFLAIQGNQLYY